MRAMCEIRDWRAKAIFFVLPVIFFAQSSCKKNARREEAYKIISEWTGKELKFPSDLSCTSMGNDTACIDLNSDNFKIVLYVDSSGCTSCRLNLFDWKMIMDEADSAFIRKPEFVFFFQPKKRDERELQIIFRINEFYHPVFIDKENVIGKLNTFPSNSDYHCFLLDGDNKVVLIGNPSLNAGVWNLFKRAINESEKRVLTM